MTICSAWVLAHLVEQRPGLHRHHEQQHQRREHIDPALVFRRRIGPDQIDGDVGAAIAGGGDAPEDQDAEQELAEIVIVGNRHREEFAHEHRGEGVQRDNADKERRDPFDRIDEAVHDVLARRLGRAGDDAISRDFGIGGHVIPVVPERSRQAGNPGHPTLGLHRKFKNVDSGFARHGRPGRRYAISSPLKPRLVFLQRSPADRRRSRRHRRRPSSPLRPSCRAAA